jgi:hypothetical protein
MKSEKSPTRPQAALKRVQAADYLNISPSSLHRIGPKPDVCRGRIRLWTVETLDKWLSGGGKPKGSKAN